MIVHSTKRIEQLVRQNSQLAKELWNPLTRAQIQQLKGLTAEFSLSVAAGEVQLIEGCWYITHSGLLGVARRKKCTGIHVTPLPNLCDPHASVWAFVSTVFTSKNCRGFVGHGDATPSNTSELVRGAEMRVAETRAVNRALRKAYGIGVCSVEELGSPSSAPTRSFNTRRMPPQSANGKGDVGGTKLRDRLCQMIRQHGLDAGLVKSYAVDFCGTKQLRDASREQVEAFVAHLSDWAEKDRNALLCQLNSYLPRESKQEGAA
jgi:hypothetical protein